MMKLRLILILPLLCAAPAALYAGDGEGSAMAGVAMARPAPLFLSPPVDGAEPGLPQAIDPVWGLLDEAEAGRAVAQANAFARRASKRIGNPDLKLFETDHFLLYTDVGPAEAAVWGGLLERTYGRLLDMFAIPEHTNIWHGKALVWVFEKREDFFRYERRVERVNIRDTHVGMCHLHGPRVRIAFFRQPDAMEFATVLVHEAVHGFLHRFRSPRGVVEWADEGLAEWVTYELLADSPWRADRKAEARRELRRRGDLGGMFDGWSGGWQYGVAYLLTDHMIRHSRERELHGELRGYIGFVKALKDGLEWEPAFEQNMDMPVDEFVRGFGESLGVADLRR